jgi:putative ABC transport system permease protein
MLFISISALSSGIGLANNISKNTERNIPFDASLIAYGDFDEDGSLAGEYKGIDLIRAAEDAGVDLNAFAAQYRTTRLYDGGDEINRELSPRLFDFVPRFMKLSDYNELLDLRGIEPLALGRNEFALNSSYYDNLYIEDLKKFAESEPIVSIGGEQFRTNAALVFNRAQYVTQNPSMNATLIVRDEALEGADPVSDILQIVYKGEGSEYESSCREALASLRLPKDVNRSLETRASVRETSNTATTTIAYLSIYLGIVFLITAAAVLAISQLSETSDNIRRYSLLRKIGTDEGMIKKALFSQILIYFGVPLSLALVHAAVGIGVMNNLTGALGVGGILDTGLFMVALMLIVYGGYFLATYFGGKNIIDRGAAKDG